MALDMNERTDAIRLIRDSAAGLAPRGTGLKRARTLRFSTPGFDRAVLERMGEMGWIGLLVPENYGGVGLGMVEFSALCEELGGSLVPEPLIGAVLSAMLVAEAGFTDILADVLAGRRLVLTAWQEAADTLDVPGTLRGDRVFVAGAAGADDFLVPVRRDGALSLALWPRDTVRRRLLETQDGGYYGTLSPATDWGVNGKAEAEVQEVLDLALDQAALATASYLLGVAEAAFALTLSYLKERQQFGRPIGSFQVLQHRATDLKVQLALARASVESAAATVDGNPSRATRAAAVSRAKARAADTALLVTRQSIQLHGAIGFTDEYDVGLYLRKALVIAGQYGSARFHRRRFMNTLPVNDDA